MVQDDTKRIVKRYFKLNGVVGGSTHGCETFSALVGEKLARPPRASCVSQKKKAR